MMMSLLTNGRLCVASVSRCCWRLTSVRNVSILTRTDQTLRRFDSSSNAVHRFYANGQNHHHRSPFTSIVIQSLRSYSSSSSSKGEQQPAIELDKLSEEIQVLQTQIQQIKSRITPITTPTTTSTKEIEIPITDRKIGDSDEEENVYRLAYDFPGFKSKNIKVTVSDNLLKIYAFQTSSHKKEKEAAEYIYEHTNEEILPDEVQADKVTASFDAENGFLVIEALLPEETNLEKTMKKTRERNEKLGKLLKQLEEKKKVLDRLSVVKAQQQQPETGSSSSSSSSSSS